MTLMPWSCAFLITVAADGESRLTIASTETPSLIIWSAIVANFALSPLAFWMSASTPAALKASPRYLRSKLSQRTEDAVSGRMTPTLPLAWPPPPPPLLLLLLSSPPHAATVKAMASTATRAKMRLNIVWEVPFVQDDPGCQITAELACVTGVVAQPDDARPVRAEACRCGSRGSRAHLPCGDARRHGLLRLRDGQREGAEHVRPVPELPGHDVE